MIVRHSDRFYSVLMMQVIIDQSSSSIKSSPMHSSNRRTATTTSTTLLQLLINCCQDSDANTRKFASFAGKVIQMNFVPFLFVIFIYLFVSW